MIPPYSLMVIKPMTVGRNQAPTILSDILDACPVSLRLFRQWVLCDTTLKAMSEPTGDIPGGYKYDQELIHAKRHAPSWICVFTHKDRVSNPGPELEEFLGPNDKTLWRPQHYRHQYARLSLHPSDTVIHLSHPDRTNYEANLLFLNFDQEKL